MHLEKDMLKMDGVETTRTVTTREGPAGDAGEYSPRPRGVLGVDTLQQRTTWTSVMSTFMLLSLRGGGDPRVSMAPCDDESTDTIRLHNKGTRRCLSATSNRCVSRPLGPTHRARPLPSVGGINTAALSSAMKALAASAGRVQPRSHGLLVAQAYFS